MPDPFARKKNPQLKAERGYTDKKSFVRNDGSEVLHNKDWKNRKEELWIRSQGKCERWDLFGRPHDAFCYFAGQEPHHIVPRSKGRDDRLENLANLSHACHLAEDKRKIRSDRREHAATGRD